MDAEAPPTPAPAPGPARATGRRAPAPGPAPGPAPPQPPQPRSRSGSTAPSRSIPTRVGRDASRIADEVIAHLAGLVGAEVTVTLEIEAEIPDGAPDNVVRTVTENSRTLKFTSQGFERE